MIRLFLKIRVLCCCSFFGITSRACWSALSQLLADTPSSNAAGVWGFVVAGFIGLLHIQAESSRSIRLVSCTLHQKRCSHLGTGTGVASTALRDLDRTLPF